MTIIRLIASIWTWFVLGLSFVVITPLMAITALVLGPFDKRRIVVGRMFRWMGILTGKACPYWRFTLLHTERRPTVPMVCVANHESFVDIFLLSHLPWEMKWMSKIELFRLPVMGWALRLAGDIPVDRGDRRSGVLALRRAREILDGGCPVLIFAEGTRAPTDELLPFKEGAFRLAIDAQVPVLPLAVSGSRSALRKHDWKTHPSHAVVEVLEPIPTTGLTPADVSALTERVRAAIAAARAPRLATQPQPASR